MMEWQPIETAPIGELVIVADGAIIAPAIKKDGRWWFWEGGIDENDSADMNWWLDGHEPTHWMPLPTAPETNQ